MHTIYLALGSNIGERSENIERAITLLSEQINITDRSPLYETKPVGFEAQDNFLNMVVSGHTVLAPLALLTFIKETEKRVGRVERLRWGPREIDIDILFYDDLVSKSESLEIPHPHLAERDFVLVPLYDIAPDFFHPVIKKTICELVAIFPEDKKSILRRLERRELA